MKKLLFFLIILFFVSAIQNAKSEICCNAISVTHKVNDDCCLEITVTNPECYDAEIILQIKIGGSWITQATDTSGGTNIVFIYCPPGGYASLVEYRVKIGKRFHPGEPHCNTDGFVEGITIYSGTQYINCCEECPPLINLLHLNMMKSNDCPDNGCIVSHSFNLPPGYECFNQYRVVTDSGSTPKLPFFNFPGDTLMGINRCIEAGTTYNARVILYTNGGIDSCVFDASVDCPEPRDTIDLQQPCTPDCFDDLWDGPHSLVFMDYTACAPLGCFIWGEYYFRKSCGQWQDIQITKMKRSIGCAGCPDSLFYQALLLRIIDVNIMNFDPKEDGCDNTYRIANGGCWSDYTMYTINMVTFEYDTLRVNEPCSLTDCCVQSMEVCKDSAAHTTTITYSNYSPPSVDCDSTWLENPYFNGWIIPCYPACNWLDGFDTTHTNPPNPPMSKSFNDNFYENKIGVSLDYLINNSQIEFTVRSFNAKEIKLTISTLNGKIIYTENRYVSDGMKVFNIDRTKLINGVYILNVDADGYFIRSDKFILND